MNYLKGRIAVILATGIIGFFGFGTVQGAEVVERDLAYLAELARVAPVELLPEGFSVQDIARFSEYIVQNIVITDERVDRYIDILKQLAKRMPQHELAARYTPRVVDLLAIDTKADDKRLSSAVNRVACKAAFTWALIAALSMSALFIATLKGDRREAFMTVVFGCLVFAGTCGWAVDSLPAMVREVRSDFGEVRRDVQAVRDAHGIRDTARVVIGGAIKAFVLICSVCFVLFLALGGVFSGLFMIAGFVGVPYTVISGAKDHEGKDLLVGKELVIAEGMAALSGLCAAYSARRGCVTRVNERIADCVKALVHLALRLPNDPGPLVVFTSEVVAGLRKRAEEVGRHGAWSMLALAFLRLRLPLPVGHAILDDYTIARLSGRLNPNDRCAVNVARSIKALAKHIDPNDLAAGYGYIHELIDNLAHMLRSKSCGKYCARALTCLAERMPEEALSGSFSGHIFENLVCRDIAAGLERQCTAVLVKLVERMPMVEAVPKCNRPAVVARLAAQVNDIGTGDRRYLCARNLADLAGQAEAAERLGELYTAHVVVELANGVGRPGPLGDHCVTTLLNLAIRMPWAKKLECFTAAVYDCLRTRARVNDARGANCQQVLDALGDGLLV